MLIVTYGRLYGSTGNMYVRVWGMVVFRILSGIVIQNVVNYSLFFVT